MKRSLKEIFEYSDPAADLISNDEGSEYIQGLHDGMSEVFVALLNSGMGDAADLVTGMLRRYGKTPKY